MLQEYKLYDIEWSENGNFQNDYRLKSINGDKVVIDYATGLMWHQSGSSNYMKWDKAKQWVKALDNRGYAGYHDWRLPTVEEAASLLESSKENGNFYIDTVFDDYQKWIWTGDDYGSVGAWIVYFSYGGVYWDDINAFNYVRPVRSLR